MQRSILCAVVYALKAPHAHAATGGSSGGGGSSGVPPVLSMLGYGTPTALANDPRVNPRAWQHGHDVDADQEQLQPNCGVGCCFLAVWLWSVFLLWVTCVLDGAQPRPASVTTIACAMLGR